MKQIATVGNFLKTGFEKSVTAQLLFLSVMVLFVYHPVLFNKFQMEWDDQWMVFNSYTTSGFTIENIKKIMMEFYGGQYGPVNQLYYTLIYSLFGYNPIWFHCIGLILHIANVIMVYILLKNLFLGFVWHIRY